MTLRFKAFDDITVEDLEILIADEVSEKIFLEYKRNIPGDRKEDRIEFLKDISAFANARGGYLIYGIEEDRGIPKKLIAIPKVRVDQEILRLNQMIEYGIRPRIQGIRFRDIPLPSGDCAIMAKVPQSFNRPHMVIYQNQSGIYSRNSRGVFQMDIDEIKEMIISSQDIVDKIKNFRMERINLISKGMKPVSTSSGPYVIMHILPFESFQIGQNIDLSLIQKHKENLLILGNKIDVLRYNLDGILGYHYSVPGKGEYIDGYIQVYRNGRFEILRTLWDWTRKNPNTLPAIEIENWILASLESFLSLSELMDINAPFSIGITVRDVAGYKITLLPYIGGHIPPTAEEIDREELIIPEVIVEGSAVCIEASLLPVFDSIWNSGAWPKSYTYNDDGTRKKEYSWTKYDLSGQFPV